MRRSPLFPLLALAAIQAIAFAAALRSEAAPASLAFLRDGKSTTIAAADLAKSCAPRRISIEDPYYDGRHKSYLACALADVLQKGFGVGSAEIAKRDLIFRAADGYARPSPGALAVEDGGWLAFTDAERGTLEAPAWDPIDRRQVDPGPFYVVWSGKAQRDAHRYPWPYQLVQIELTTLSESFPLATPKDAAAGSAELAGYELFRGECIACHSMNGQGGKVGPDLNVPRSIVEYRPEEQIRQYIRNPASFRYTSMPAHENFGDSELDALVAYFRAMSRNKHDPGAAAR